MAGELNLITSYNRAAYLALDTPQQAYVLLEVLPAAAPSSPQAVNFCLVLDRSGSMAGEKLLQMKAAASLVVDRLGPADLLSVVTFDDSLEVVIPLGPVVERQVFKDKINAIGERGGTHMSFGMHAGLKELLKGQSAERVSRMLLLTDGQTWEDQEQCELIADTCRQAGIPISVLGFGVGEQSNWDPRLLEDLAMRSGGEWTIVDAPEKVSAAFASTLQTAQGSVATHAMLTLRMVEGVTARALYRVMPLIGRLGQQAIGSRDVQVFLGDIQQGAGLAILADVLLPPRQPGAYRLIQVDVTYDVPESSLTQQRVAVDLIVPITADAAQANQTQGRVMNLIERVVAHKLQTQALDEAAAGDIPRATQRLRAAATRLLELGEGEMADEANQQAARLEQAGQIDPAAMQRMRYATKRLSESELEENAALTNEPPVLPALDQAATQAAIEPIETE